MLYPTADDKTIEQIRFIYQKARHHRTFHADSMWASVTPQMEVQFAFFSNLKPLPDEVTHMLTADGHLGDEVEIKGEQRVIREVDATVVMNKETVKLAIELLQRMLNQIDELREKTTLCMGETGERSLDKAWQHIR